MYPYNNSSSPYPGSNPGYPQQQGSPYPSAPTTGSGLSYPASPYPNPSGYPGTSPYPGSCPAVPGYAAVNPSPYSNLAPAYPGACPVPFQGQIGFASPYPAAPSYPAGPYPPAGINSSSGPAYPPAGINSSSVSAYPPAGINSNSAPGYPPIVSTNITAAHASPSPHLSASAKSSVMATSSVYQEVPSVRPGFGDPLNDAQALRKAMKGFGTDEKGLIQVLCRRTDPERVQIANAFKSSFGKDLIADIKSEVSGNFETLLVALCTPKYDYISTRLHDAIDRIGTKESVLIDVLCTSSNQELQWIQAAYYRLYGRPLEQELTSDTSGSFRRLLVSLCAARRIEDPNVSDMVVTQDVNNLISAGVKKWGTDESVFNMILANRSYPHLRSVFHQYEVASGQSIEKSIKAEFSGDIEDALIAIVKCVRNRSAYFAERLRDSMQGMGTKDDQLIFIMVTRCDVDLESIKVEYQRMYNSSLANDISKDTSGDYKKGLIALLGM